MSMMSWFLLLHHNATQTSSLTNTSANLAANVPLRQTKQHLARHQQSPRQPKAPSTTVERRK